MNVLTREKIDSDQAEKKRQKDLLDLASFRMTRDFTSSNVLHAVLSRERGEVTVNQLKTRLLMSNIETLQPSGSWTVVGSSDGIQESVEHMVVMESTQHRDKLLGLWSVKDCMKQRLQLLHLVEQARTTTQKTLSLSVRATDTNFVQSWNKISNVCWAEFSNWPDRNNVLYTTMSHTGYSYSLAFIRNLDQTRPDDPAFDYNLGSRVAWTCAWNYPRQQFSVGSEKRGMLIDVETRRLWDFEIPTDPFTQVFSPHVSTCNCVFV